MSNEINNYTTDSMPLWIREGYKDVTWKKRAAEAWFIERIMAAKNEAEKQELNNKLAEVEKSIDDKISELEKAIRTKSEHLINMGRVFQSYRLCVSRATTLHAAIYGTSNAPLFPFDNQENSKDDGWNQNVEITFDAASLSYGPLILLDLFTKAKTELQLAKKRHRVIDACAWFALNLIRAADGNNFNADAMSTLLAGTLLLGYAIDLINQYYLDRKELLLTIENINKIYKFNLENNTDDNKDDLFLKGFEKLELNEDIIPSDELAIYKLLQIQCADAIKSGDSEVKKKTRKHIEKNLQKINEALVFQKSVVTHRKDFNLLYASALLFGAFALLSYPAGMGVIILATIANQVNGFFVMRKNYLNNIAKYHHQLKHLDNLEGKAYEHNLDAINEELVAHNLRPIEKGENIQIYICAQKISIKTKIKQADRQSILHSYWYAMNITIIICLLAVPVANVGFAAALLTLAIYGMARKYCLNKNAEETKEIDLYTKALCIISKSDETKNSSQNLNNSDHKLVTECRI
ncbi:MAG: hypothetical protein WC748_03350 [Legionellales bacterium]|jgi:hypothetical protein